MSTENILNSNNFTFVIPERPELNFSIQSASLPAISLGVVEVPTPHGDYTVPGTKMIYDPISLEFLVDENLENWLEIHDWIVDMRNMNNENFQDFYSDGTLTVLSNMKNPLMRIDFQDMFPVSLSEIPFSTTIQSAETIVATVAFEYTQYKFDK